MTSIIEVGGALFTQHAASRVGSQLSLGCNRGQVRRDSGRGGETEITGWRLGVALLHKDWVGPVGLAISTTFPAPTHIWGPSYSCNAR